MKRAVVEGKERKKETMKEEKLFVTFIFYINYYLFVCLFIRNCSDDDLEKAIKMSEQEALDEEKRKREKLEKENAENLFGTPAT
jgi:hypothetical protein